MRLFGEGGRFPFMRRSTHMAIYVRDAQVWKRDLRSAEAQSEYLERVLARERHEWAEVLDKLTRIHHEGVDYALVGNDDPRNLVMREIVARPYTDTTLMAFSVTNHLLDGARRALEPRQLDFVARLIAGETTRLLVGAFVHGERA